MIRQNDPPTTLEPKRDFAAQLAGHIGRRTAGLGSVDLQTAIAGLAFFRRETPTPPTVCLVEPSAIFVVQGEKRMWLNGQPFPYNPNHFLITSLDIPANSEVVSASPEQPCLGVLIRLDLRLMAELIAHGSLPAAPDRTSKRSMGLGTVTEELLAPCLRLVALLDEPEAIGILAPLILREIHFRLLISDQAAQLRQTASIGSQSQRIAKAVEWIKTNFTSALSIDELAARAQMSPSTLHHHFRQLTGMSPLQYQKWMRLNEARRLLFNEQLDAASCAFRVGYESPSQFSREYSRLFGAPPIRDIESLRQGIAG